MPVKNWFTARNTSILIIVLILLCDQLLKFWIKTHLTIGESVPVFGNWFILHYTENPGMAFGMKFWGIWGKIILGIFRIIAVGAIIWYINQMIKKQVKTSAIICVAAILAGAIGNIIDNAFYGFIFDSGTTYDSTTGYWISYNGVSNANFMGYAGFLQGCVVDMLYFPIIDTTLPSWVPIWGGEEIVFFRPIFNIADSAISCGVIYLLLFHRKTLMNDFEKKKPSEITEE